MKVHTATRISSGVSDEAGRIGAVESDDGLLDLIDLLKGERIVLSEAPLAPLFVSGQEVLVSKRDPESYAICVELLQICPGRLEPLWAVTLRLPEWAPDGSSTVSLEAEWSDGTFQILWSAHRSNVGGIIRSSDYEQRAAGLIRIDEKSGAVTGAEMREPDGVDEREAYRQALRLELIPVRRGPDLIETPWSIEGREVVLTRRGLGGETGVFLRFLGNVKKQDEREVALPEYKLQDPIVTIDGGTVLLYDGSGWDLFSAWDGTAQGRLPLEENVTEVSIINSLVLYSRDEKEINSYHIATRIRRVLHARDLESGALLWSYFLHDKELQPDPRTFPGKASQSMFGGAPPMTPGTPFGEGY